MGVRPGSSRARVRERENEREGDRCVRFGVMVISCTCQFGLYLRPKFYHCFIVSRALSLSLSLATLASCFSFNSLVKDTSKISEKATP